MNLLDEILKAKERNITQLQLSKETGISNQVISCICVKEGIKFGRYSNIDFKEELLQAQVNGMCASEIGKKLGVSRHTIHRQSKILDIPIIYKRHRNANTEKFLNRKFGKLTVIGIHDGRKHDCFMWKCRCECGNEKLISTHQITSGIQSCGCAKGSNLPTGEAHWKWNGYKEITGKLWNNYIFSARRRGIKFSISKDYAYEVFQSQKGKCALSGLDISLSTKKDPFKTASIDRIDSSKGYEEGNIQWVGKAINMMKMSLTQDEFVGLCKTIVDHNDSK